MIENSFIKINSNGKQVVVEFWENNELRKGPAIFPARYSSFAGIISYAETQLNHHKLGLTERVEIQELLGSPWPKENLQFYWKNLSSVIV